MSERECLVCKGTGKITTKQHGFLREQYLIMMRAGAAEERKRIVADVKDVLRKYRFGDDLYAAIFAAITKEAK